VGVAEHLLAAQHAVVAEHDVLALGQVVESTMPSRRATRRRGARRRALLDLLVVDDAPSRVSIRNILPGCSRPLATTLAGSTSITPTSDAITTRSSSVTQ
jgi:hypothetical protein